MADAALNTAPGQCRECQRADATGHVPPEPGHAQIRVRMHARRHARIPLVRARAGGCTRHEPDAPGPAAGQNTTADRDCPIAAGPIAGRGGRARADGPIHLGAISHIPPHESHCLAEFCLFISAFTSNLTRRISCSRKFVIGHHHVA